MDIPSLFSFLVSLVICLVSTVVYYQTRTRMLLLFALAFALFSISFLISMMYFLPYEEDTVLITRMCAFLIFLYVVYSSIDEVRTRLSSLSSSNELLVREIAERKRAEENSKSIRERYFAIINQSPIPQFVIDTDHRVTHWNRALEKYSGIKSEEIIGTRNQWMAFYNEERPVLADLLLDGDNTRITTWYGDSCKKSGLIDEAYESTSFIPKLGENGTWLYYTAALIRDGRGNVIGAVETLEDISRSKQAEMELERSANTYRTIFNTTEAATIIIEKDMTISLANSAFARLSGYSIEELEGNLSWTRFVAKDDLEWMKQYHQDRRQDSSGTPHVYEFKFIDRFGSVRYCLNNVAMIPGSDRSVASILDITDRVLAEMDYRSIFENIQDVFYRTDLEGNLTLLSPSALPRIGYQSLDDLLGKNIATTLYFNPDDRIPFLQELESRGSVSNYEILLKRKDGTPIWTLTSSHTYYDINGNVAGIEGVLRDISDWKKAQDELKQSENMYRAIFDTTGAATIIIGEDTTVLLANAGWVKLTGVPREEQEGRMSWTVFIDREDVEMMKRYHYARRQDPSLAPRDYECRVIDADGNLHYCYTVVGMIAGTKNSVASLVDITELRAEEEKNKRSLKEKEVLLKEIHHRVKNNLQVVSGLIELQILSLRDPGSIQALRDSQNRISTMALIHESLYRSQDLAKIEVSSYIQKLVQVLFETYSVSEERIRLEFRLDNVFLDVETGIHCGLIVNELVSNVFKHAFPDGREGIVTIAFHEEDSRYTLEFSDNGVGIPEGMDIQQSESLGLKLVTMLATDQLEGRIEVIRDGGTKYVISFPKKPDNTPL
jgi:PAS domain S-box-containing protein